MNLGTLLMVAAFAVLVPPIQAEPAPQSSGSATQGSRSPGILGRMDIQVAPAEPFRVERMDSRYPTAPGARRGRFVSGQEADLVLGARGFNQSGGPTSLNRPAGLATDGRSLLVSDRWNNRVLYWKRAPASNTPPDLVLGQPDFLQNQAGEDPDQMNWPGGVALGKDGSHLAVADTMNDRVLLWDTVPTVHGRPANRILHLNHLPMPPGSEWFQEPGPGGPGNQPGPDLGFPWGVWTDGDRLAAVATHGSAVLVWNHWPTRDNQAPDLAFFPPDSPSLRSITSDGKTWFGVGDPSHRWETEPATLVWLGFPTNRFQTHTYVMPGWSKGHFLGDGRFLVANPRTFSIWNSAPTSSGDSPVLTLPLSNTPGPAIPDIVSAGNRLYVLESAGSRVLGWNQIPNRKDQPPDFSLGSPEPVPGKWPEGRGSSNPLLASDGTRLFAASSVERTLCLWLRLPDASSAPPDLVIHLPGSPNDIELHGNRLALSTPDSVYLWEHLPLEGEPPDRILSGSFGGAEPGEISGVAFDEKRFYLSDRAAGVIHVWDGFPKRDQAPRLGILIPEPGRLDSDGTYLSMVQPGEGPPQLWRIDSLEVSTEPMIPGSGPLLNSAGQCLVAEGRLFVANRNRHRIDFWNRVEDALQGKPATGLIGTVNEGDRRPFPGRNRLLAPGSLAWGAGYLWVGESRFSSRILRFSPRPNAE